MSWAKLDDGLWCHPKFLELSLEASGVWVRALSWCAKHLTDGAIPRALPAALNWPMEFVAELVSAGLWEPADRGDGWKVHDYLEFNPSKAEVASSKDRNRKRVQKYRDLRSRTVSDCNALLVATKCVTETRLPIPDLISSSTSSRSETISLPTTTTTREAARSEMVVVVPEWAPRADREIPKASVVGYKWFETLMDGRGAPDFGSWGREYETIGAFPEPDRLQVARSIRETVWCSNNRSSVTPKHVVKYWESYLAGPRNPKPLADTASTQAPSEVAYQRMRAAERAWARASDVDDKPSLLAEWAAAQAEVKRLREQEKSVVAS